MRDDSPLCFVCDGPVMPGAPIALCKRCIVTAHDFARTCVPDRPVEFERLTKDRCPLCDLMSLIRNKTTGEVTCNVQMGGCGTSLPPLADMREVIRHNRERREREAAIRAKAEVVAEIVEADKIEAGMSRVYYIRLGDEIKIGVSINPEARVKTLSLTPSHIVATEIGTQTVETVRHRQFKHLRLHGEWFKAAPELLAHIESLKSEAA